MPIQKDKRRFRKLGGEIWGVTVFYNPSNYKTKYINYKKFRKASKKQGLKLLVVELAFEGSPFELKDADADKLIFLRGESENILWQKENLINYGISCLPKKCDKVIWIDADILFSNNNWVKETARLLDTYPVVQPYESVIRLKRDQLFPSFEEIKDLPIGDEEGHKIHSIAYGVERFGKNIIKKNFIDYGHTGFAWAARRKILERCPLYELSILGSGDSLMAHSMYGSKEIYKKQRFPSSMEKDQRRWGKKIYSLVKGKVAYTPGTIFHLWHGQIKDRAYIERYQMLRLLKFNLKKDVIKKNHLLAISPKRRDIKDYLQRYFWRRNEDGSSLRKIIIFYQIVKEPRELVNKLRNYSIELSGKVGGKIRTHHPKIYLQLKKYFPDKKH